MLLRGQLHGASSRPVLGTSPPAASVVVSRSLLGRGRGHASDPRRRLLLLRGGGAEARTACDVEAAGAALAGRARGLRSLRGRAEGRLRGEGCGACGRTALAAHEREVVGAAGDGVAQAQAPRAPVELLARRRRARGLVGGGGRRLVGGGGRGGGGRGGRTLAGPGGDERLGVHGGVGERLARLRRRCFVFDLRPVGCGCDRRAVGGGGLGRSSSVRCVGCVGLSVAAAGFRLRLALLPVPPLSLEPLLLLAGFLLRLLLLRQLRRRLLRRRRRRSLLRLGSLRLALRRLRRSSSSDGGRRRRRRRRRRRGERHLRVV
eukprot:Rhum_TRINITY_DN14089_c0_g1::Rhum_TRINITY_DN14089_c0_g1_i1::g.68806::m.68806